MSKRTGVALFSTLRWPEHALGERSLLVIESYDPCLWQLDEVPTADLKAALRQRGFVQLQPGGWSFPYLENHLIAIDESAGDFALIDDAADELFAQPLNDLPPKWYAHVRMERNCLLITGIDLHLATTGLEGVHTAVERGDAFGAMVLINDGSLVNE